MAKSTEYSLVKKATPQELSEAVTKLLAEGWILYGPPFVSGSGFCQALTREKS